jgi:hypothetical protein
MTDEKQGFVSLKALRGGPPDSERALAEIRQIYFKTTRQTVEHDLAHAIELLKSLPNEEDRERARVYMDGLSQMRSEWSGRRSGKTGRSGKSRRK